MRIVMNGGELTFPATSAQPVPFINLNASNPSAIFTALLFAAKECDRLGQSTCFVTFDQPLYAKASEIIASSDNNYLQMISLRLGGFHLLMSFLGAIGYMMSGSGLEELWCLVYARNSVIHMISGHAYARALRAHFLTQRALLYTLLESSRSCDYLKGKVRSAFEMMISIADKCNSSLLTCEIDELFELISEILKEYSAKSRTAALWIQYLHQVRI